MQFLSYTLWALSGVYALSVLIIMILSRKPLKILFLNTLLGIAAFVCVELTSRFTGVHIPLNEYSAAAFSVLGVPGVCGVLLLKVIFGV